MATVSPVDLYMTYKFLRVLTTPFKNTDAYKLGIIDEKGTFLKKRKELETNAERRAYPYFNRLIWNLKKLIEKLPGGRTKVASYASALFLLKEEVANITEFNSIEQAFKDHVGLTEEDLQPDMDTLFEEMTDNTIQHGIYTFNGKRVIVMNEDNNPIDRVLNVNIYKAIDMETGHKVFVTKEELVAEEVVPLNNVGGGAIAGTDGSAGKPMSKIRRRKKFAGVDVFEVNSDTFNKCLRGKKKYDRWSKYLNTNEDSTDNEILQFARQYPNKPIIIQNDTCGTMMYLRNYKLTDNFTRN